MSYLIHVGLLLAACFLYYRFLLQTETHFGLKRWLLLGCVVLSFGLPLLTIPQAWSFRTASEAPIETITLPIRETTTNTTPATEKVTNPTSISTEARPVITPITTADSAPINWPKIIFWVYLAGVLVFGFQFLLQIGALFLRMLRHPGDDLGDFRLVELDQDIAPYSFWNRIFLNPAQYDPDTFHQIVEHEQIHINQKHSFDILLAELLIVVQWWNPFAWFYRSAIEHNLEFLTDAEMIRRGTDPITYQLSLVRVAIPNHPQGLTSNYNQSFLEKRITMMKAKHSSNRSAWKYLALLPLLIFSVLQLNAVDQSPVITSVQPDPVAESVVLTNVEAMSAKPAAAVEAPSPSTEPVTVSVNPAASEVKPQPKIDVQTEVATQLERKHPALTAAKRSWTATLEGNDVCFHFIVRSDRFMSTHEQCIPKKEFGQLPGNSMSEFSLTRYAGTMNLRGIFEGKEGLGTFEFTPSQQFIKLLENEGYSGYSDEEVIHFFYADFGPGYLQYIRKLGYTPSKQKLLEIALFFDNQQEIEDRIAALKRQGFQQPSLQQLIELQIHGITDEYIEELASLGYTDLSLNQIKEAKIHGISAAFLSDMKRGGFKELSFQQAKEMSIHGVSSDYIAELNALGYTDLDPREVVNAKIHGVSTEQLAGLKKAGLDNLSLQQAKDLAIHGITADYAYELAQIGFTDLSADELVSSKIHGVNADQMRGLQRLGYEDISLRTARNLAIHGVNERYIRDMKSLDLEEFSLNELQNAKIHGVSADYVRRNRDKGDSLRDFINMRIHGN